MTGARNTQEYLDAWATNPPPPSRITQAYLDVWATLTPPPTLLRPGSVAARGGAVYLDSYLEYDGRHVATSDGLFPGVTLRLTGGSTWAPGETLTLQASGTAFTVDDIGNVVVLHGDPDEGGADIRFTVTGFAAGNVTGTTNIAVPVSMQDATITTWDRAVDVVAGLEHLEGEDVGILGDDHVVGSPNNVAITIRTVTDGQVDLGDFYTHVYVGLPYLADLETLDIDTPRGASLKSTKVAVTGVGLMVLQSRSIWVGGKRPTNDTVDPLEGLSEMPRPEDTDYETLRTDFEDVNIEAEWNSNGRVFIRSVDPVPATVLAAIPQGYVPSSS